MEKYTAELTIYDERNGETVSVLRNIELEDNCISEDGIEQIEDFISTSISQYEEDVYV